MRVVHLVDSLGLGGAQRLLVTFAEAARDVDVTVINLKTQNNNASFDAELQAMGVRVVRIAADNLTDLGRLRRLTNFLRQEKFNVGHTHLTYAHILGAAAGRLSGTPMVATIHNTQLNSDTSSLQRIENFALRKGMKRIIAVGHLVKEVNQPRFPNFPFDVIPNAVPALPEISAEQRTALRTELTGNPARPLIISVGRLHEQKGYPMLLDAFAAVHQQCPDAALVIVGGGVQEQELEAKIDALSLRGHASLAGRRNDVPALLAASDIYVNSSLWEGLPVTVLEAMSARLPIVATAVGDVPRVVVDGTGIIVPPKQPQAIADGLLALLRDPEKTRQMGTAAKAHVIDNYSPSVWANKILNLYEEVRR